MSKDSHTTKYPDTAELYRAKEARRKTDAKRSASEKIASVSRLREFEQALAGIRKDNKAKRAAKQIQLKIKTR